MVDKILVNGRNQANRDALRSIYEQYRDCLLIIAIALSNDVHTAEDAVHDVFVTLAGTFHDFRLAGSMKAYLTKCVVNRVRDLMRAKRNRAQTLDSEQDCFEAPDMADPCQLIVCNEQLQMLSSALAKLPHEQREVIVLHIYGQMRFRSIAKSFNISTDTIKGRYRYGMSKLRSILNSEI